MQVFSLCFALKHVWVSLKPHKLSKFLMLWVPLAAILAGNFIDFWHCLWTWFLLFFSIFCLCMFVITANKKNISRSPIMASNFASISSPAADRVHYALVSAVSKAGMSDFTESVAPKSIQKALPTEWNFCWRKDFSLTVNLLYDT